MTDTPASYIQIGGQTYDSTLLTYPSDRKFRDFWAVGNNSTIVVYDETKLANVQEIVVNNAFSYMANLIETEAQCNVQVSAANNSYHYFGCDKTSRENIMGINGAIASVLGNTIPDPRSWLPKGELVPIQVSHLDLAAIGVSTLAKVDQYYQVYFGHKYNIMSANTIETVAAYDFTTGYSSLL